MLQNVWPLELNDAQAKIFSESGESVQPLVPSSLCLMSRMAAHATFSKSHGYRSLLLHKCGAAGVKVLYVRPIGIRAEEEHMRGNNVSLAVVRQTRKSEHRPVEQSEKKTANIRVFVAETDQFVRCGLLYVLDAAQQLEACGEAADAKATLELIDNLQPDVALIGDRLAGVDMFNLVRSIKARSQNTKVLVLGNDSSSTGMQAALQAGALGYCSRTCPPNTLLNALQAVSQGAVWIDPSLSSLIVQWTALPVVAPTKGEETLLSTREVEVLRLVSEGRANIEIAGRLCISPETVKTHIKHIMEKLAASDRTEAAVKAIRNGLV
jgi:NarL family two-component system response regulator LiaR